MGMLDGKVALITGAGGGLGRAYALLFAREGAKVVVNDLGGTRDGSTGVGSAMADKVVAEIRELGAEAVANYASVSDAQGAQSMIDDAIKRFGKIDIVVNNAGILRDKTLVKLTEDMWDIVVDVHMKGTFLVTQAAVNAMLKANQGGRIINTSSYAGLIGNFGQSNYGAAKAGIAGFTRVVALETRKYGITCNAIAPIAKTRMTEDIAMVPDAYTPDDIAPLIAWLASDDAAEVTGRVFGAHGRHYFEYTAQMTPGVDLGESESWTPASVGAHFEQITQQQSAATGASDAEGGGAAQKVKALFAALPTVFKSEKAGDWKANIQFEVKGTGTYALSIESGKASFSEGAPDKADGKVVFDSAETLFDMVAGKLAPEQAFMSGKLSSNNMGVLMKFGKFFDLSAAASAAPSQAGGAPGEDSGDTSSPASKGLNRDVIGKKYKHASSYVLPEEIVAYAHATEDHNPRSVDVNREAGIIASPLFAVKPMFSVLSAAIMDEELNADVLRLVHGEQEMVFHRPIKPWDLVAARGMIESIESKSSGEIFDVKQWLVCEGDVLCEATSTLFVRSKEKSSSKSAQVSSEATSTPEIIYQEEQKVSADQPLRYADASGDHNPIHTDPEVARSAGLPNIILQGLCTLAFAAKAVVNGVCEEDSTRLRRLKVRFAKPVLPEMRLTTRVWKEEEREGRVVYGFETVNEDGVVVLKNGLAEVDG